MLIELRNIRITRNTTACPPGRLTYLKTLVEFFPQAFYLVLFVRVLAVSWPVLARLDG